MDWDRLDITQQGLSEHYRNGDFTPHELIGYLLKEAENFKHKNIWIELLTPEAIAPWLDALDKLDRQQAPLWGVPFAIKDNIDLAGIPTTAGCREFSHTPSNSAFVVQRLLDAGAIPLGKASLDQFATGLVGTRTQPPQGPCRNAFDDAWISGGSSSGSAVAVSLGLVSFALGTDTAGSGRVPAALNNIVGLKPTRGLLSSSGMVPACKSLDTISLFALTSSDAATLLSVTSGLDPSDCYSRQNPYSNSHRYSGVAEGQLTLGIPEARQLQFFGDDQSRSLFESNLLEWRGLGAQIVEIDFEPFMEAAQLLYQGPWVTERYIATRELLGKHPEAMHPVVRQIIEPGANFSAAELFEAEYRLAECKQRADAQLARVDLLMTPTLGRQYRIDEVLTDPIRLNSNLGYYTNYMNLLDYSAVAVPGGFTERGIPSGFTLVANRFQDRKLLNWATRWQNRNPARLGNTRLHYRPAEGPTPNCTGFTNIVVCGAHLEGLPLNWQLRERGAYLFEKTMSAANYRLYALADGKRPGMVRDAKNGAAIEVEVWRLPTAEFGSFVAEIPAPLGIGKVELVDGRWESGFICDAYGLEASTEITHHGGWRNWLASK